MNDSRITEADTNRRRIHWVQHTVIAFDGERHVFFSSTMDRPRAVNLQRSVPGSVVVVCEACDTDRSPVCRCLR